MNLKQWIEDKIRENSWENRLNEESPYEQNASIIAKLSKLPKKKIKLKNGKTVEVRDYLPEIDEKKQEILDRTGKTQVALADYETGGYSESSLDEEGAFFRPRDYEYGDYSRNSGESYLDAFGDYKGGIYTPKEHNSDFKQYLADAVDEGYMDRDEARDLWAEREYQGDKLKEANKDVKEYTKLTKDLTPEQMVVSPYRLEEKIDSFDNDALYDAQKERAKKYKDYITEKYGLSDIIDPENPEYSPLLYYIQDFIDDGHQSMWSSNTEEFEKTLGNRKDEFIKELSEIGEKNPVFVDDYNGKIYTAADLAQDIDGLPMYKKARYYDYDDNGMFSKLDPNKDWVEKTGIGEKLPRKNSSDYGWKNRKLNETKHKVLDDIIENADKDYQLTYDDYLEIMNNLDPIDNSSEVTGYYLDDWLNTNTEKIDDMKKLKKKQKTK